MAEEELTERELEIIRLVATGATNQQIALKLSISANTVKVHLNRIFTKLNVESRTEAALYAVRRGWVAVEGMEQAEELARPLEVVPEAPEVARETLPFFKQIWLLGAVAFSLWLAFFASKGEGGRPESALPSALTDRTETSEVSERFVPLTAGPNFPVYRWASRARMPTPRGRFALVAYEDRLYAIGGDTAEGVTDILELYSPEKDRWEIKAAKPTAVSNIGAAAIGEWIYVPGGTLADGEVTNIMEAYNAREDVWEKKKPLPRPLCAYAIAAVKGKLYLFGGWDGRRYVSSAYMYNPQEDLWTSKTAMPTARGFAGAGVVGGKVYVVGGYNETGELATCEEYDPARDNGIDDPWTVKAPLVLGRGGLGVAAVGNNLYAVGGGWESYLAFNERYDPKADMWVSFETPFAAQWRNVGVAALGTKLYAIGGWSGRYLSVNEEYQALFPLFLPNVP
ncbi:MAG: Kelch repeat-containing protein [Anaerolineae bacterium]